MKLIVPLLLLLLHMEGAAQTPQKGVCCTFHLPEIPASLTTPEQRAGYLAMHYWDAFDFTDPTSLATAEQMEPIFADFLTVLPIARDEARAQAVATLLGKARSGDNAMFPYFADLFEKYLWDTASPLRSDELYIPVLQQIVAMPDVSSEEKIRPRALLDLALRNRPGAVAEDITFNLPNGHPMRLSKVKSNYVLLFFNSPDCEECLSIKSLIASSATIQNTPGLTVVAICPRGEESGWRSGHYPPEWINGIDTKQAIDSKGLYDLRVLPSIYLLDNTKRVLLKNTTLQELENFLSK